MKICDNSGVMQSGELTDAEAVAVAKQIAELAPSIVCLCGGEPMLRGNLQEIIKCVAPSVGSVNMVTNGMLVEKRNARELKESGLAVMQVSLDGINPLQHDTLRCHPGSFNRALRAIEHGVAERLEIYVSLVPNKLNYRTIIQYAKMCLDLGVRVARVMPLIPMGRGKNITPLLLSPEEYIELQLGILKANLMYKSSSFVVEWGDPLDHYSRMPLNARMDVNTFQYEIKSNGNITVSTYIPVVVGNVRNNSLKAYWEAGYKKIWGNSELLDYISSIQTIYDLEELTPSPYSGEYLHIDLINM